jgi:divalent metal cation (Fe/Co/Zn/Cd) transporter
MLRCAAGCMALMQATGNTMWDAAGSIAVSLLLGGVAITLIQRNRSFLIGRSMPESERDKILAHLQVGHGLTLV